MANQTISEVTRRNIADAFHLNNFNWAGRFEEQQFLGRLYNLAEMRSTDRRFANASDDIWQHRVRNRDWGDDWVFYDSRFNIINAPDEEFLRFLCETLHPVVQPDPEQVECMRTALNEHLVKDGWELREQMRISARPVFAASRVIGSDFHTAEASRIVSQSLDTEYVSRQITRMQAALASDPDAAIGTAKEFVETVCKTILRERGIAYDDAEKFPRLVRQAATLLELVPKEIAEEAKTKDTVKRLLSNLATISDAMAELRNEYGTGHGKEADAKGLDLKHARLAVGAATSLAVFLMEAHMDIRK